MVYLEGLTDDELKRNLTERLDIVRHKIKFMDQVPVFCADTANEVNIVFYEALIAAGALLQTTVDESVYLIYLQSGTGLNGLMRDVPAGLNNTWPQVQNNRVILIDQDAYNLADAESSVGLIEDLAEMIHPGSFVFGNEGSKWIRFRAN